MAGKKKRVALLSNVTVDLVAARLGRRYDLLVPDGFDTWVQEAIDPGSKLYEAGVDAVVVLLDGTEARSWTSLGEARERLDTWKQAVRALVGGTASVPVFVTTIDVRENRIKSLAERRHAYELENEWYQFAQSLAESHDNVYVLDLADAIREVGRRSFYSNKMWYLSSMPWSREGLAVVAREVGRALSAAFDARRKVVALDLDNTLWGGVVGEDGVGGIELSDHKEGQRFHDFQRQLLEMRRRGVVLAIDSKNNPEDAEAAIREHPAMLLRDGDFAIRRINWEGKAKNLKEMERELNVTEAGFVFVDDNPAEREEVRALCPEVLVPDFPTDTSELLAFAEGLWEDHLVPLRVLDEDRDRTAMYRAEAARSADLEASLSLGDYLKRLEIRVDIHRMRPGELDRVAQLCNKTNQFNLTTRRYTRAEVEALANSPANSVYVLCSSDRYGDSGLVGVMILVGEGARTRIDTFLMSCRAMGRGLEGVMVGELVPRLGGTVVGEFVPTAKNAPVRDLYDRLGFGLVSQGEDGGKVYELDASSYVREEPAAYASVTFEGEEVAR